MTTKYYIEFVDFNDNFMLQSKWFDTENEALLWLLENFDFIDYDNVECSLMYADFDKDDDFGDIELSMKITPYNLQKFRSRVL